MSKKILKPVLIITTCLALFFGYKSYKFNHPKSTGAILTEAPIESRRLGDEVSTLKQLIPYQNDNFTIASYNYTDGKFVVISKFNIDTTQKYLNEWLNTSEFSDIPLDMFEVVGQ